ncbi:MAG: hypothetical protein ACRDJJ_04415 [Actinomycetota bacterium]
MPELLRSRIALFAFLGAFLIPIFTSSLRGLTHVLTCRARVETPFSLQIPDRGQPQITTSTRITRGEERSICGGLSLNMAARIRDEGRVSMVLPISNDSRFPWHGTVELVIEDTPVPVGIGRIAAGETETDVVDLRLDEGTHQIEGSLLIGP